VGQAMIHKETEKEPTESVRRALAAYEPLLCRFSALTGLLPHFYCDGDDTRAPRPNVLGEAHIFTCAHPPGECRTRYFSSAGGIPVAENGNQVVGYEPTAGRGITLGDESGTLVQVIGSNIYLLLPTLSYFDPQTSSRLFEYLLTLGWEGYRRYQLRPPSASPAKRKDFIASARQWVEAGKEDLIKSLAGIDAAIEQAQKDMAGLLRSKRELNDYIRTHDQLPFVQEAVARLPGDYRRIKRDPNVAMIAVLKDGIHVDTWPLHVEHEGRRYAIGSFTIRIGRRGAVSVWCETPLHPKGIPHPHIAKDGGPCFGNATSAILQAGAEHRYYDAVTLVLRWLKDGYSPQLASVKIEEWPRLPEEPAGEPPKSDGQSEGDAK